MEKIKVIFTGGTIGSLVSGNDINTNSETQYLLLNKYGKNLERFTTSNPLFILSENANLGNVILMAKEIKKSQEENIKGIILTHGTDTLSYTAAYLSFILQDLKVPVVLVSSDYVLTDERANGNINFAAAVSLIDSGVEPNVYVAYKNFDEDYANIHLAVRMKETPTNSSCYYSAHNYLFAKFINGKIVFENTKVEKSNKKFEFDLNVGKRGLFIHPYLGLDYNVYKNIDCDFVLHNLYHSGTANTQNYEGETDTNFLNFADFCKNKQIPLYLCNIKKQDINYSSTNLFLQKDIKPVYNTLTNIALAKLYCAYNFIKEKDREEFLNTSICGEVIDFI